MREAPMWHSAGVEAKGQPGGVLSFCRVGPDDWAQLVRLGSKRPCPLSHLTGPRKGFLWQRFIFILDFCFETGFYYMAETDLELSMPPRLVLNSRFSSRSVPPCPAWKFIFKWSKLTKCLYNCDNDDKYACNILSLSLGQHWWGWFLYILSISPPLSPSCFLKQALSM